MPRPRSALLLLGLLIGCGALSGTSRAPATLDRALRDWLGHPTSATARVLIQVRPDAGARTHDQLKQLAEGTVAPSTTPNVFVAALSPRALRNVAGEPYVTHVSSDALVRSLTTQLSQDVLL